jgi:hypothetical protein
MESGAWLFEPLLVLFDKCRLDEAGQLQKGADRCGFIMIGMASPWPCGSVDLGSGMFGWDVGL